MGDTFDQQCRDAETILNRDWPKWCPTLPADIKQIVVEIMVDYGNQIELKARTEAQDAMHR